MGFLGELIKTKRHFCEEFAVNSSNSTSLKQRKIAKFWVIFFKKNHRENRPGESREPLEVLLKFTGNECNIIG
jgi:hypothetical protein